ncbi:MAG: hypothetical protein JSW43_10190 [Gemmatimonadota bacterium]|nr:MAG: hypothetical protein JSW43_10190 [Gemmatimonadota bacterium]
MPRPKLAETVVWVVVVGLLAVLAVMHLGSTRQQRRVSAMREELRRFAVAQESFRYDIGVYAADVATLEGRGFEPDAAIVVEVREATADGWAAVASHERTNRRCYLYVENAAPVGGATRHGSLECD